MLKLIEWNSVIRSASKACKTGRNGEKYILLSFLAWPKSSLFLTYLDIIWDIPSQKYVEVWSIEAKTYENISKYVPYYFGSKMLQEKVVIVLDVGSMFKEFLEPATCAIGTFLHEKMINKPAHKVGLVVCGSNDEALTVEECICLEPVTEKHLAALSGIEPFRSAHVARSYFDEGIIKAIDLLHSDLPEKKKGVVREKVVLITCDRDDCSTRVKDSLTLLQESKIKLQIVQVLQSFSDKGPSWIHEAVRDLHAEVKYVYSTYQMRTCFPVKQYSDMHVIYSHTLLIGAKTEISVKLSTKVRPEAFPSIGNMQIGTELDSLEPSYDRSKSHDYFREDDFEQKMPIDMDNQIKGFRVSCLF